MHDSLVKFKELGFLPDVDLENVTVFHGSRLVNSSARLSDLCTQSGNNLFVIDFGTSCEEEYFRRLREMGFSSRDANRVISECQIEHVQMLCEMGFSPCDVLVAIWLCGNSLDLAMAFLTMKGDQDLTGNNDVTHIFEFFYR